MLCAQRFDVHMHRAYSCTIDPNLSGRAVSVYINILKSSPRVRHLLHGDPVDGEGEKCVALSLAVGVTRVDEGSVARLGVGGPGCRNNPGIIATSLELCCANLFVLCT